MIGRSVEELVIYGGLALNAFLATTILPASSEVTLAGLMATGKGAPLALFAAATVANTAGSVVNWFLGRGIDRLRFKRWFPVKSEQYERTRRWFGRIGVFSLLFAWLPIVGDPLTVAAGALRVPLWTFVALVGIGKAARYGTVIAGSMWWLSIW